MLRASQESITFQDSNANCYAQGKGIESSALQKLSTCSVMLTSITSNNLSNANANRQAAHVSLLTNMMPLKNYYATLFRKFYLCMNAKINFCAQLRILEKKHSLHGVKLSLA